MLGVWPVVKRYVLGTQARQVSLRASSRYGGWSCRSGDVSEGGPEVPFFFSPVFFLLRPSMLSYQVCKGEETYPQSHSQVRKLGSA